MSNRSLIVTAVVPHCSFAEHPSVVVATVHGSLPAFQSGPVCIQLVLGTPRRRVVHEQVC